MRRYLLDIQERLRKGFHLDNLRDIGRVAASAADDVDHPLPFFIISRILLSLDDYWREYPMAVSTAKKMADALQPSLDRYLAGALAGISPELEVEYLNDIVKAFIAWQPIQRELRQSRNFE
jgi:hypothetical protein